MDKDHSWETGQEFDFLDKNSSVSFEIEPAALAHLPQISMGDAQTGRERFRVLLGTYKIRGPQRVHIVIKGIYEETKDDVYGTYREGVEQVTFNLSLIRTSLEQVQRNDPAYKDFQYLGDVHTHPVSGQPFPSEGDLLAAIEQYNDGILDPNQPYIFGIAARRRDGEMEYNFFRMFKDGDEYAYMRLDS